MSRIYDATLALGGALGTAAVTAAATPDRGAIQIGTLTALAAYVARRTPLTDRLGPGRSLTALVCRPRLRGPRRAACGRDKLGA